MTKEIIVLMGLALLGQGLHILFKLYEDYNAMLATPDEEDDKTFWKIWRRRNLVVSMISVLLTAGLVIAQYFMFHPPILSREMAFGIGYMLDSFLKNFNPMKKA